MPPTVCRVTAPTVFGGDEAVSVNLRTYAFVPVGNYKMNTPGKDRNEAGTPLKDIKEYDKFKFVII